MSHTALNDWLTMTNWLTEWREHHVKIHNHRAILKSCDPWDMWSEWSPEGVKWFPRKNTMTRIIFFLTYNIWFHLLPKTTFWNRSFERQEIYSIHSDRCNSGQPPIRGPVKSLLIFTRSSTHLWLHLLTNETEFLMDVKMVVDIRLVALGEIKCGLQT